MLEVYELLQDIKKKTNKKTIITITLEKNNDLSIEISAPCGNTNWNTRHRYNWLNLKEKELKGEQERIIKILTDTYNYGYKICMQLQKAKGVG